MADNDVVVGPEATQADIPLEERFAAALTESPEASLARPEGSEEKPEAKPEEKKPETAEVHGRSTDEDVNALLQEIDALAAEAEEPEETPAAEKPKAGSDADLLEQLSKSSDPGTKTLVNKVLELEGRLAERDAQDRQQSRFAAERDLVGEQKECIQKYGLTRDEFTHSMKEWAAATKENEGFASLRFEEVLFRIFGTDTLVARMRPTGRQAGNGSKESPTPSTGPAPARVVTTAATGSGQPRTRGARLERGASLEQIKNHVLRTEFGIDPDA